MVTSALTGLPGWFVLSSCFACVPEGFSTMVCMTLVALTLTWTSLELPSVEVVETEEEEQFFFFPARAMEEAAVDARVGVGDIGVAMARSILVGAGPSDEAMLGPPLVAATSAFAEAVAASARLSAAPAAPPTSCCGSPSSAHASRSDELWVRAAALEGLAVLACCLLLVDNSRAAVWGGEGGAPRFLRGQSTETPSPPPSRHQSSDSSVDELVFGDDADGRAGGAGKGEDAVGEPATERPGAELGTSTPTS